MHLRSVVDYVGSSAVLGPVFSPVCWCDIIRNIYLVGISNL